MTLGSRPTPAPIHLDATDRQIIRELKQDARIAWAELGRRVSLTPPAVRDRVRRMERAGVITGYHAAIDPGGFGRPIGAIVRVSTPTQARVDRLVEYARERDEVVECHTLTGDDSVLLRLQVSNLVELDRVASSLANFGRTTTSMILDTPIQWRTAVTR
ncbi:MAG: Lrp/AsnC family transcriptional regulator [Gaiellales bacterium]